MAKRILTGAVGIIVIAAIAYTGASWFIGQRAETLIRNRVEIYNQQLEYYLPDEVQAMLSIDDYQRHVFTTDTRYTLTISEGGDTREVGFAGHLVHGPFPYTEIKHGNIQPLLVASHLRLLPTDDTQALFAARSNDDQSPVTARTTLTFRGTGQSVWQFQPLASADGRATFSGGTATIALADNYRDATLSAEFGEFRIADDGMLVRFQGIGISGEASVGDSGATTNRLAVSVVRMAGQGRDGLKQESTDVRLAFGGTLAQGLVDGKLQYSVGHMQSGQLDLGTVKLLAHVENVDAQAVRALQKIVAGLPVAGAGQLQRLSLQAVVNRLLAAQPVVAIDKLRWQTPVGTSTAALNLHFVQPEGAMGGPLAKMLADAVQRGELDLSVSKPMAVQALRQSFGNIGMDDEASQTRAKMTIKTFAGKLKQTGLFKVSDERVQTAISYQDRKFNVNGKAISIGELSRHLFMLVMTLRAG